jgi:Ser/Thr protein kinase RdoA (MazF antagonist)
MGFDRANQGPFETGSPGGILAGSASGGLGSAAGSQNRGSAPSGGNWMTGPRHLPTPTFHDEDGASASSISTSPAGTGQARGRQRQRAKFDSGELATVCSHFDIGVIESVREFRRGSGRAPKVLIRTDRGEFLLKRRVAGTQTPSQVAFSHAIQLHLAHRRFPLPRLIGTRTDTSTMLLLDGHVYELFEFVPGDGYDSSLDATADAGRALGLFHGLLISFHSPHLAHRFGTYHNATGLDPHLEAITAQMDDSQDQAMMVRLRDRYARAAQRAEEQGFATWPRQIIHGDWHPGNMLFRGNRVAAVIDYDTARRAPRAIDIANGALQFSITMNGRDPLEWPAPLDEGRLKRFCRGYETVKEAVISVAELHALPWLMIEALIVEGAVPIAATGSFAGHSGAGFLRMVEAKTAWLESHAERLTKLVS